VGGKKLSKASTATAVLSLIATGKWNPVNSAISVPWSGHSRELAERLLREKWESAGLPPENVFTTAFILEAVTVLERTFVPSDPPLDSNAHNRKLLGKAERILRESVQASGGAKVLDYPPSGYVTQLVVRTLARRNKLGGVKKQVLRWAWSELANQLALITAKSKTADLFQLAYTIMLVVKLAKPSAINPDQARTMAAALRVLFEHQLEDGSWPRSRPLFHYQKVGSAYCYEYEMLVQLIEEFRAAGAEERLLPYIPRLRASAEFLRNTGFKIGSKALAWSSGHHPQLSGPESWSTASAYHFVHALNRLLAEAIRQSIFEYVDAAYAPPTKPNTARGEFAKDMLDSTFKYGDEDHSLKKTLFDKFVEPLARNAAVIRNGLAPEPDLPTGAIFFGPPGTSKTELTKRIADYVGWPRLSVDPSHLIRNGLEQVHAEANRLFGMLAVAEEIVVLLDEFDELLREREIASDILSRFLTTAMLPKLAAIKRERRIVFIVATNHIEAFDIAISRPGRFDLVVQVMPPSTAEKMRYWPAVFKHLKKAPINLSADVVKGKIGDLTFDEFRALEPGLRAVKDAGDAISKLERALAGCTLQQPPTPGDTVLWRDLSVEQVRKIRLP
jgi:hypothetical protein